MDDVKQRILQMMNDVVESNRAPSHFKYGEANFLLSTKYPQLSSSELPAEIDPLKWLSKVVTMGVDPAISEPLLARVSGIRVLDMTTIEEKDYFFFPGGVKHVATGFVYLRKFHSILFENPSKFGLLIGFIHRPSTKSHCAHTFTAALWARVGLDLVEQTGAKDVELSLGLIKIHAGRRQIASGYLDVTDLNVRSSRYVSSSLLEESWGDVLSNVIERVHNGRTGRYQFLCGDYSSGLSQRLKALASHSYGIDGVVVSSDWSPVTEQYGALLLCDLDNVDEKTLKGVVYAVNSKGCYCVFSTQTGSNTELLGVFESRFGMRDILRNIGGYYIRRAVPALCEHCKQKDESGTLDSVVLPLRSPNKNNLYKAGHGCSYCAEGVSGVVFCSENMSSREAVLESLLPISLDKSDPDSINLRATDFSPFSLAIKTASSGMGLSVLRLLQSGDIQISDIDGLLY